MPDLRCPARKRPDIQVYINDACGAIAVLHFVPLITVDLRQHHPFHFKPCTHLGFLATFKLTRRSITMSGNYLGETLSEITPQADHGDVEDKNAHEHIEVDRTEDTSNLFLSAASATGQ